MAEQPKERESLVDDMQQDPPNDTQPREVKEPDNERWWENPGVGGEMQ